MDVNTIVTHIGWTALHWAIRRHNADTVSVIIRHGAEVDQADWDGLTPLSMACQEGDPEIVKLLLRYGASPNLTRPLDGASSLQVAFFHDRSPLMKSIISVGANVNIGNDIGFRMCVEELLKAGVDACAINVETGSTLLHLAARKESTNIFLLLLKHGADINALDNDGMGVVGILLGADRPGMFVLALDHGLNPNVDIGNDGRVIRKLQLESDVVTTTPLMYAAAKASGALVSALLRAGAWTNVRDQSGGTALLVLIAENTAGGVTKENVTQSKPRTADFILPIVIQLIKNGANPTLLDSRICMTAGHVAVVAQDAHLMKVLVRSKLFDPNFATTTEVSILDMAILTKNEEIVKDLLPTGRCDLKRKGCNGLTAMALALRGGWVAGSQLSCCCRRRLDRCNPAD